MLSIAKLQTAFRAKVALLSGPTAQRYFGKTRQYELFSRFERQSCSNFERVTQHTAGTICRAHVNAGRPLNSPQSQNQRALSSTRKSQCRKTNVKCKICMPQLLPLLLLPLCDLIYHVDWQITLECASLMVLKTSFAVGRKAGSFFKQRLIRPATACDQCARIASAEPASADPAVLALHQPNTMFSTSCGCTGGVGTQSHTSGQSSGALGFDSLPRTGLCVHNPVCRG